MKEITVSKIVSVSRRTDIPAFYPRWFYERLREGKCTYRNPWSGEEHIISLVEEDVSVFVFWSRNYAPFLDVLKEVSRIGYGVFFHFTITGIGPPLEPKSPPLEKAIDNFKEISEEYGKEKIVWRFDPIIITQLNSIEGTLLRFDKISKELEGYTKRCITSFVNIYPKLKKRFERASIQVKELNFEEKCELLITLDEIARARGMELFLCSQKEFLSIGIKRASCVDGKLLSSLYPGKEIPKKVVPTRRGCSCTESKDIGKYNTCKYRCIYCYAIR